MYRNEFYVFLGVPFPSRPKPASKTRTIVERKKVPKKPYYDEVDQEALKLMIGQRVEWSKVIEIRTLHYTLGLGGLWSF